MADEIAIALKDGGYDALTAYSAKEAFELLAKNKRILGLGNRIRCIILDIKMPEMDGLQFLEKLREDYQERVGVIILSAYEDVEKWAKARHGLAAGYLTKPYKKADLLMRVKEFFDGMEDQMIELTSFTTQSKEFALRVKEEFDPEKIRDRVRKKMEQEEEERERVEEEKRSKKL